MKRTFYKIIPTLLLYPIWNLSLLRKTYQKRETMRWSLLFVIICYWSIVFVIAEKPKDNFTTKSETTRIVTTTEHWRDRVTRILKEERIRDRSIKPPTNITVFNHVLNGTIPVKFIYEDEQCAALYEAEPQAPIHFLVIPRKFIRMLSETTDEDEQLLGHLLVVARKVAEQLGLRKGYRVVINSGSDGFLPIKYLTINVLGGRAMHWPPGK